MICDRDYCRFLNGNNMKKLRKTILFALACIIMLNISVHGKTVAAFARSSSKDASERFDVPKNGAEIRDISTDHIRKMSLIKWQTSTKIDFTESTDWTGALLYEPGVQYVGTPYVSNRLDGDSDL